MQMPGDCHAIFLFGLKLENYYLKLGKKLLLEVRNVAESPLVDLGEE